MNRGKAFLSRGKIGLKQAVWAVIVPMMFFAMALPSKASETKTDVTERLDSSGKVLQEIMNAPDKGIPDEVLSGAKCIAVVPNLVKGGFVVAAKRGNGVATCRLPNHHWSAPAFFVITGGSWGLQIGVEDVQLVMVFMNDEGARHLMEDKFQIGGSASATAGPVGRHAEAGTDWKVGTEILTYSRAKGLFAGIDLGGSWIEHDKDATEALYGSNESANNLLTGQVPPPAEARPFIHEVAVARHAKEERKEESQQQ
jgi:SH3 domain-containing YSC84-like protein 1